MLKKFSELLKANKLLRINCILFICLGIFSICYIFVRFMSINLSTDIANIADEYIYLDNIRIEYESVEREYGSIVNATQLLKTSAGDKENSYYLSKEGYNNTIKAYTEDIAHLESVLNDLLSAPIVDDVSIENETTLDNIDNDNESMSDSIDTIIGENTSESDSNTDIVGDITIGLDDN